MSKIHKQFKIISGFRQTYSDSNPISYQILLFKIQIIYMHQQDMHTINYCNPTIIWICLQHINNSNKKSIIDGFDFSFQFAKKDIATILYSQLKLCLSVIFLFSIFGHRFYKPVTYEFTLVRPSVRPSVSQSVSHEHISATKTRQALKFYTQVAYHNMKKCTRPFFD